MKAFYFSAYTCSGGEQFMAVVVAANGDAASDWFEKKYPDCDIADCWEDQISDEEIAEIAEFVEVV